MSFNTALSGLNAASSELAVVTNNVANSATTGFKSSRAEFADVYATSSFGGGANAIGSGVLVSNVAQQFKQGNMEFTDNTLDMAMSGRGFFVLHPDQNSTNSIYTRAGAFQVNSEGFVTNSNNEYLQVFPVNADGTVKSTSLASTQNLRLPSTAGSPSSTSLLSVGANLPSDVAAPTANFDPTNSASYNASTSTTVYDSQGAAHIATMYFVKVNPTDAQALTDYQTNVDPAATAAPNMWRVFTEIDGQMMANGATSSGNGYPSLQVDPDGDGVTEAAGFMYLSFNADGNLSSTNTTLLNGTNPIPSFGAFTPVSGANSLDISLDFVNNTPTQFSGSFNVTTLTQDGFTTGRLTGIAVGDDGVVRANYSNGQQSALGKIALASFANEQGLSQNGNTSWTESIYSGAPLVGEAGTGSFGSIRSGALETSNVDLTGQLVKLITAQRNFQANAKSIETNSAITQTVINLR